MKKIIPAALLLLTLMSLPGCAVKNELIVGKDIKKGDITDFYYTVDASTNPPHFQRYRFYAENGKCYFYHEKREGDHWPLTEEDATVKGTVELNTAQWDEFFSLLEGGTVIKRQVSTESGGSGPWTYLYWKKDLGEYQEFSFETLEKRGAFEEMCMKLAE